MKNREEPLYLEMLQIIKETDSELKALRKRAKIAERKASKLEAELKKADEEKVEAERDVDEMKLVNEHLMEKIQKLSGKSKMTSKLTRAFLN